MTTPARIEVVSKSPTAIVARLYDFEVGVHKLKAEHVQWLKTNFVGLLRSGGSMWIAGLASPTDTNASNFALSRRRADEVTTALRKESPTTSRWPLIWRWTSTLRGS